MFLGALGVKFLISSIYPPKDTSVAGTTHDVLNVRVCPEMRPVAVAK